MILEAQFGSNIAPIERPKLDRISLVPSTLRGNGSSGLKTGPETNDGTSTPVDTGTHQEDQQDEGDVEELEEAELARLHALGIPVPGIEIKVDKHVARVWLETLEVECSYPVLRDRVRVVVERAVETVAGLWSSTLCSSRIPVANGEREGAGETLEKDLKMEMAKGGV